jgi:hypothetical protein
MQEAAGVDDRDLADSVPMRIAKLARRGLGGGTQRRDLIRIAATDQERAPPDIFEIAPAAEGDETRTDVTKRLRCGVFLGRRYLFGLSTETRADEITA